MHSKTMALRVASDERTVTANFRLTMSNIRLKRVYDPADADDGFRVLVDGVWPRGMTKEQVGAGLWLKEAAPSTKLRKWFGHDRSKWEAFKRRYFSELDAKPQAVAKLRDKAAKGRVTLLFSARDAECNQAVALREYLVSRCGKRPRHRRSRPA
ncbi:MAG TPA: DUF488 domain-containing protein [Candidatus Eisenbacteria bacterium]|nr:DUF488 domain-containing protein [Candidatus Eisenbacteria bacterium]